MLRYTSKISLRIPRILKGPFTRFITALTTTLSLIAFFNQSLLDAVVSAPSGISPWWGLLPLFVLLFYGFLRASYEELRDKEQEFEGSKIREKRKASQLENENLKSIEDASEENTENLEQLKESNERLREENQQLRSQPKNDEKPSAEHEQLKTENNMLKARLKQESDQPNEQLTDEELRQLCLGLAEEVFDFLEEHALGEADRAEMNDALLEIEVARADAETMRQFRKLLKMRVMNLCAELKRRGWWESENTSTEEQEGSESLEHPDDIRIIAKRLEQVGYAK